MTVRVWRRRKNEKIKRRAYDDVRFDKVRYGIEDALCAAGLLLAPEREAL
jgi:hypothetical protein